MRRPPHSPRAGLFSGGLGAGWWYRRQDLPQWQTIIFTTLAFAQIGQALATRSIRESLFRLGLFSNRLMAAMVMVVAGLQLAAVYLPLTEDFFKVTPLTLVDLLVCVLLGAAVFAAIEIEKWSGRRGAGEPRGGA
jgi:Ca2+-transporting ATPase